jgi:hypothetical protein
MPIHYYSGILAEFEPAVGDPYLLFDEKARRVEWRRVPYDIEATVKKIENRCGQGSRCATHLRIGR